MQQTEKYQFDLIEGSDLFLPDALNGNAVKLEAALDDHKAEVAQLLAGQEETLSSRARTVFGSYVGTGVAPTADAPMCIELDGELECPPRLIIVTPQDGTALGVLFRGMTRSCVLRANDVSHYLELIWTDRGVRWYIAKSSHIMNTKDSVYHYIVFV